MDLQDIAARFAQLPEADRRWETRDEEMAIVGDWMVAPTVRRVVRRALATAERVLGLEGIRIRWMIRPDRAPANARRILAPLGRLAFTEPTHHPRDVFLSPLLPNPVLTALHELRHLWQYQQAPWPCGAEFSGAEQDRMEVDAIHFAAWVMQRYRLSEPTREGA